MKSMHTSNCGVTVWNVRDGERKQRDESVQKEEQKAFLIRFMEEEVREQGV